MATITTTTVGPPGYMPNQGIYSPPPPAIVHVTTTSSPAPTGIRFNPYYFFTVPGALKIVQVVFAIVCFSCASPVYSGYASFLVCVASSAFTITLFFCAVYLLSFREWLSTLPWIIMELIYTFSASGLYAFAAIVQLACSTRDSHILRRDYNLYGAYISAGVFALFNAALYAFGSFLMFSEYKQTQVVRGQVVNPPR